MRGFKLRMYSWWLILSARTTVISWVIPARIRSAWSVFSFWVRRPAKGIAKKVAYLFVIAVAMVIDYIIIQTSDVLGFTLPNTMLSLLVTVWYLLNEALSITENAGRMGAPVPGLWSTEQRWKARLIAIERMETVKRRRRWSRYLPRRPGWRPPLRYCNRNHVEYWHKIWYDVEAAEPPAERRWMPYGRIVHHFSCLCFSRSS